MAAHTKAWFSSKKSRLSIMGGRNSINKPARTLTNAVSSNFVSHQIPRHGLHHYTANFFFGPATIFFSFSRPIISRSCTRMPHDMRSTRRTLNHRPLFRHIQRGLDVHFDGLRREDAALPCRAHARLLRPYGTINCVVLAINV